jgi:formamidopyrimidine-DNA glycosylase
MYFDPMPELPELEVVCEVLQRRVIGETITGVKVIPPGGAIVVRDLTNQGFEVSLVGGRLNSVIRRGKFLVFSVQNTGRTILLVPNPKLTGRLQLATATDKKRAKTHIIFTLGSGRQLRYYDQKQMGQLYLSSSLDAIPGYAEMGPEPFEVTLEEFRKRIKPFRGEIKGVLTRGEFIAGIGNAYADEILWEAHLHPFRKRTQLTPAEVDRLFEAMRSTLSGAIEKVRAAMQEIIDQKPRDFMAVHMKTGDPCPRCGTTISLVGSNDRITNFCRTCQPGGLIKGM